MKTITEFVGNPLEILALCGGYYECPKGTDGKRCGPLVGYAGRDEVGKQFVGDVYVNFAMAERQPHIMKYFTMAIMQEMDRRGVHLGSGFTGFCGAPEGGKALAVYLAGKTDTQYIFPEKKITALKTTTSREVSELVFDRHIPDKGDVWWIVEDVCNNFSTTLALIKLIEKHGATVAGIVCFLNRSDKVDELFVPTIGDGLPAWPVIPVVRKIIPQYRQDDPQVIADIAAGNVVWKPKNEWAKLAQAMADHKQ